MLQVLGSSWALLFGMMLLMVGNGLQSTALGVRADEAGISTLAISIVMSAYFVGFLGGSRLAPRMIKRVGHVRVFAFLGSFFSAVLVLFPALPFFATWLIGRIIVGFCLSGLYVTAESWLNNSVTNERRGQALSLYMIFQMLGVVTAQQLLFIPDPTGFLLFIIPSVLVSLSFAPILLSISPTPAFEMSKPMSLKELFHVSPLGFVGMALLGGIYSAQFAMAAVYGTMAGFSNGQIATLASSFYVGALVLQFPIGWISDRVDRRLLILAVAAIGGVAAIAAALAGSFLGILAAAFLIGGMSNPLYALLIAYSNDYLEYEDMASASGGLLFVNGIGAIIGPPILGYLMGVSGPSAFFIFIAILMLGLALYAAYRMTQRATTTSVEDMTSYAPIIAGATPVAVELAQEVYIEQDSDDLVETDREL